MRESDLQKHLSNDKDTSAGTTKRDEVEEEKRAAELEKTLKPLEYGSADDFQLKQAINHLKGLPVQLAKVVEKADANATKLAPDATKSTSTVPHKPAVPATKVPETTK